MLRKTFRYLLVAALVGATFDASAVRRSIRIDGFGDWAEFAIGSPGCPGTTAGPNAGNTLVDRLTFTFSGRMNTAFLVDDYCQVPDASAIDNFAYGDEEGLGTMLHLYPSGSVTGIRYSMLDQPRFDFTATGFQWTLYTFPTGVTVVGLYGLEATILDDASYIRKGTAYVWKGSQGYDGQYFCFRVNTYLGPWNGDLSDSTSQCLKALRGTIFSDGFES